MNYFKQIYYEMKHQKMMTWVSISGTALAIFMVMIFMMSEQIYEVESAPELNRSRILYGQGVHLIDKENNADQSTTGLSYEFAKSIYGNLEGIEAMSYFDTFSRSRVDVGPKKGDTFSMTQIKADAGIWNVYDYRFIDGRPFNAGEADSQARVAVISRSSARKLFGKENVAGQQIDIDAIPYTVVGVIEDTEPVLTQSCTDVLLPYNPALSQSDNSFWGSVNVMLLAKKGTDISGIKKQVEQSYHRLQPDAQKEGYELVYHEQPYTSREMGIGGFGSNTSPDTKSHDRKMIAVFALLIILPAINLSSMTRSRLRHRVSEIGVRRAFGAKRNSVIGQIFGENFIISLMGGAIGLILSVLFIVFMSNFLFSYSGDLDASLDQVNARPDFWMIFRWSNFLWTLLFCFVLNILSASVPAWRASRVEPAVALSSAR